MVQNVDESILQDLVDMNIRFFNFSPISAKICAYLHFDISNQGFTFEELKESLGVSKGSISLNLKILTSKNIVQHSNKFADRKTYYFLSQNYFYDWLKNNLQKMEIQASILKRISTLYHNNPNSDLEVLKKKDIELNLIQKGIQDFKDAIDKFEKLN